jgi:hypothetical protein
MTAHVRWLPGRRSIGPGLIFLVLFSSRRKEQKNYLNRTLLTFFCLCPDCHRDRRQKVTKKSTPAMKYSHCRRFD